MKCQRVSYDEKFENEALTLKLKYQRTINMYVTIILSRNI